MGSGCSSEEAPKVSPRETKDAPIESLVDTSIHKEKTRKDHLSTSHSSTMSGKRRPVRTKSIVEGEAYDMLLVRHSELKPTLKEFDQALKKLQNMNKITEEMYPKIYELLDKKVDDPFQDHQDLEQRLVMGNYLAKNGFVPHLVDVYQAVWSNHDLEWFDDDLEEEESESEFFKLLALIRTILWNYADGSPKFAESIVNDTQFFQYLTEDLLAVKQDLEELEDEITNENHFPFNSTLGILNNCARNAATKDVYSIKRLSKKDEHESKDVNMVEILQELLKTDITYVKLVVLLALSYMVNEEQNRKITADESIFDFLLDMVHKAEKANDRRQWGFSIHELINGLAKLAKNDENKTTIMKKGAFQTLKRILKQGNVAEQIAVVNVIWELSFAKKNKELFKNDKEVWKTLQNLYNSDNEELSKAAQGACFVINEGQDKAKKKKEKVEEKAEESAIAGHIMLSYNWANQKILLQIRDRLQEKGFTVWMDVDNMEGSILEAMARAVEEARIILVCYSEKYKDSQNCRTEAEYAYSQKKEIIPLLMERGYKATGWLGAMIGAKLFYDFSGKYDFDRKFGELYTALTGKIFPQKTKALSAIPENAVPSLMPASDDSVVLMDWTRKDIEKWLNDNQLTAFSGLKNLSGKQLVFLYKLFRRAPEYFYRCIEEKLGMKSLEDLMKFSDAIEKLQAEYPDINRLIH
ncbi:uncharacterized protein LOC133183961 [Saccostrea echinata]|uniref:uncharacterized protein LOC133183961 n=1 Tax=Saccostrea echinata TaxID=191078 RepID=UPI002A81BD39|nr:uncharacterized protein LOC133183961 [Saccostrea echinata]